MKVLFEFQTYCSGLYTGINNYKSVVLEGDYEKLRLIKENALENGFDIICKNDSLRLNSIFNQLIFSMRL